MFFLPIGKSDDHTVFELLRHFGQSDFSETAERNSTKPDRNQYLNVLVQVCVLQADKKNKMAALVSD